MIYSHVTNVFVTYIHISNIEEWYVKWKRIIAYRFIRHCICLKTHSSTPCMDLHEIDSNVIKLYIYKYLHD